MGTSIVFGRWMIDDPLWTDAAAKDDLELCEQLRTTPLADNTIDTAIICLKKSREA